MKLKSTLNIFRGAFTATAALCLMFAGSAKADCGLSSAPRSRINMDALKRSAEQAQALAARAMSNDGAKPDLTINIGFGDPITGLWLSTFKIGGEIADEGFDVWNSDGTEILNDTPPPATGNVCLGTWVRTGSNAYKLYHPSWTFDAGGNLNGMAIIRETITLAADRQSYKGTFTIDVLALSGATLQHLAGDLSATRITVD